MRQAGVCGILILGAVVLTGCEEPTMTYDQKEMPFSEVEERIADELEVDNPHLDLEVKIYEEGDDE